MKHDAPIDWFVSPNDEELRDRSIEEIPGGRDNDVNVEPHEL